MSYFLNLKWIFARPIHNPQIIKKIRLNAIYKYDVGLPLLLYNQGCPPPLKVRYFKCAKLVRYENIPDNLDQLQVHAISPESELNRRATKTHVLQWLKWRSVIWRLHFCSMAEDAPLFCRSNILPLAQAIVYWFKTHPHATKTWPINDWKLRLNATYNMTLCVCSTAPDCQPKLKVVKHFWIWKG